jgi:hypothetical protein
VVNLGKYFCDENYKSPCGHTQKQNIKYLLHFLVSCFFFCQNSSIICSSPVVWFQYRRPVFFHLTSDTKSNFSTFFLLFNIFIMNLSHYKNALHLSINHISTKKRKMIFFLNNLIKKKNLL